jgi:hypothetical protein
VVDMLCVEDGEDVVRIIGARRATPSQRRADESGE